MGNPTPRRVKPCSNRIGERGPARRAVRTILRMCGRVLLFLLARVKVVGGHHFPKEGPLILAGNHVGVMEVMMMAVIPPYSLEFIGSGDIPLDPNFAWLAKLWGFIPVNRGNLDRAAISRGVDILNNNGFVVIFPEGGIWNPGEMKARIGIAALSGLANSPVLPVGFGGMKGSLAAALRLKRPLLEMRIGEVVPAVQLKVPGLSKKQALEKGAEEIWAKIWQLIPGNHRIATQNISREAFHLSICLFAEAPGDTPKEADQKIAKPEALARFLLHPVIMDIFTRNLQLPVDALVHITSESDPGRIRSACADVLGYLVENPGFLTYRFGMQEGIDMQIGVRELHDLAGYAQQNGYRLMVQPERRYFDLDEGCEVIENTPGAPNQY